MKLETTNFVLEAQYYPLKQGRFFPMEEFSNEFLALKKFQLLRQFKNIPTHFSFIERGDRSLLLDAVLVSSPEIIVFVIGLDRLLSELGKVPIVPFFFQVM